MQGAQQVRGTEPLRVVVIGAGPRGTSAIERLAEVLAAVPADRRRPVRIDVVDPFEPGPGRVWRTDQHRLFLMNTPSFYPTVAPERPDGAHTPGLSFEQFRASGGDGAQLSEQEAAELAAMSRTDYPPRALYGAYLRHVYRGIAERLRGLDGVDGPLHHAASATTVDEQGERYRVGLDDGSWLVADHVVLALGHVPARLTPAQEAAGRAAASVSAVYEPPHVPSDLNHERIPAGETLLVRGMGLNFFDLMIVLTQGRGGRFVETGEAPGRALRYEPSGHEPRIVAGSRRGAPYRAKSAIDSFVPRSVRLRHLSYERIITAARDGVPGRLPGTVDFDRHVWPLLHRDVTEHYYRTLADASPEAFPGGAQPFLENLAHVLEAPADIADEVWTVRVRDLLQEVAPGVEWFDIRALAQPWAEIGHTTQEGFAAASLEALEHDAAGAALGEADPEHQAIGALHAGRLIVKRLVAEGVLDEQSVAEQVRGWFEPLVEGLASGPPLLRIEQLAALVRAGVVRILGADPVYTFDEERGVFTASSPWVDTPEVTATWMVEAMMPPNRVSRTDSPLLRGLLQTGLARPRMRRTPDGEEVFGSGLDVTGADHHVRGRDGAEHLGFHVLGLQLSSVQWGTAIAAEAGAGAEMGGRTLADAEAVARSIVDAACGD